MKFEQQNKLKFIPLINIVCVVMLLKCLSRNTFYLKWGEKQAALIKPIGAFIVVGILFMLITSMFEALAGILSVLCVLTCFYVLAEVSVREQCKLTKLADERKNASN